MKKSTKVIVSSLAGLTLLTGGFAAGASFDGLWAGENNIHQTKDNIISLDSILNDKVTAIDGLNQEKSTLEKDITDLKTSNDKLNGQLSTVEAGAKQIVNEFLPEFAGLPTRSQLVAVAEWITDNPGAVSAPFKQVLAQLEADLGLATDNNKNLSARLVDLTNKYDAIKSDLAAVKVELDEAAGQISDLNGSIAQLEVDKETLSADLEEAQSSNGLKDGEITDLEAQLEAAELDAQEVKDLSQEVLNKHSK